MANLRSLSAVGLLSWAFAAGTASLPAEEKSPPAKPAPPALLQPAPTAAPAEAGLPIGSRCNVQTIRSGTQVAHTGKIVKVTAEWLVLERNEPSETMQGVPILNKVPYNSRLFTVVKPSNNQESSEIWIPRDTILFVSVTPHAGRAATRPALLCEAQPGAAAKKGGVMRDSFIIRASASDTRHTPNKVAAIDVAAVEERTASVAAPTSVLKTTSALYSIVVQSKDDRAAGARRIYYGRIVALDGDHLVVAPVVIESRSESSVPLLGRLPYLARLFRNTGVGLEDVDQKEVRISLQDVSAMRLCSETDIPGLRRPPSE